MNLQLIYIFKENARSSIIMLNRGADHSAIGREMLLVLQSGRMGVDGDMNEGTKDSMQVKSMSSISLLPMNGEWAMIRDDDRGIHGNLVAQRQTDRPDAYLVVRRGTFCPARNEEGSHVASGVG